MKRLARRVISLLLMLLVAAPAARLECAVAAEDTAVGEAAHGHHAPATPTSDSSGPEQRDGSACAALMCSTAAPTVAGIVDADTPVLRDVDARLRSARYSSPVLTFDPPPPRLS